MTMVMVGSIEVRIVVAVERKKLTELKEDTGVDLLNMLWNEVVNGIGVGKMC